MYEFNGRFGRFYGAATGPLCVCVRKPQNDGQLFFPSTRSPSRTRVYRTNRVTVYSRGMDVVCVCIYIYIYLSVCVYLRLFSGSGPRVGIIFEFGYSRRRMTFDGGNKL